MAKTYGKNSALQQVVIDKAKFRKMHSAALLGRDKELNDHETSNTTQLRSQKSR